MQIIIIDFKFSPYCFSEELKIQYALETMNRMAEWLPNDFFILVEIEHDQD